MQSCLELHSDLLFSKGLLVSYPGVVWGVEVTLAITSFPILSFINF